MAYRILIFAVSSTGTAQCYDALWLSSNVLAMYNTSKISSTFCNNSFLPYHNERKQLIHQWLTHLL